MSLRSQDSLPRFFRSLTASQKVFVRNYVETGGDEFLATKRSGVNAKVLTERIIRRAVFELASRHIAALQRICASNHVTDNDPPREDEPAIMVTP
jgi:hypothetical protein